MQGALPAETGSKEIQTGKKNWTIALTAHGGEQRRLKVRHVSSP